MNQMLFKWLSIDLGQLNVVGWLLMLVTLGLMGGIPLLFFDMSDPNLDLVSQKGNMKVVGLGAMVAGIAVLYGARFLLERAGMSVHRTPMQSKPRPASSVS